MAGTVGQNMISPSDFNDGLAPTSDETTFYDVPKEMLKLFKEVEKYVDRIAKSWKDTTKEVQKATGEISKNEIGGGRLGLGSFTRTEKMVGLGMGAMAVGSAYMSMAPSTMSAVTQRIGADTYAGISGMSSRQAIMQANRQVGGGATSAMGPTMAAANLYASGYTASSLSSKNIMSQLGGLSAMSGMSNEAAAGAIAGINSMSYLRLGIQARDSKGNLRPPNQLVNQVYNALFRGQKITTEQAAISLMNPGGKGYQTLMQITGGDAAQMQMLQSGLMARATKGSAISAADMRDPNKMLDAMGVDKSSPLRANFRYNSSENKKLEKTEQGLVRGYDASLRTAASLNDAYSKMADILGPVNDGLMTLKGILQTFPNAGGMGGTVSSVASAGMGLATTVLQGRMLMNFLGKGKVATNAGKFASVGGKFLGKAVPVVGTALSALGGYNHAKGTGSFDWGEVFKSAGMGAVAGGVVGSGPGALIGALLSGGGNAIGQMLGKGGEASETINLPTSASSESASSSKYLMPVPKGTPVSSPFGHRKGGMVNGVKISSNHKGMDFAAPENTPITALADGTVVETGRGGGWGNYVLIKHKDGSSSRYAHLNSILVSRGQKVKAGTVIGKSGGAKGNPGAGNSTSPHLHFEYMNAAGVRVNPAPFLRGVKTTDPKYTWTGYKRTNFMSNPKTSKQITLSSLGSPSLSTLLSSAISSGEPVSWEDISGKGSRMVKLGKTGSVLVNSALDKVDGDSAGMTGGSRAGLMKLLHDQGFRGKGLHTAFAVALAESGGRADAIGDENLQNAKWGPSIGAFQIRSLKNWQAYNDPYRDAKRLKNGPYNIKAAFAKSKQGTNFKGWSTFTSGSFAKFLDDAHEAAGKAGVGGPVANEVNLPSGGTGNHGAAVNTSATFNARSNVTIELKMNVHIARSSVAEAEHLVKLVGQKLKNDAELKMIASSL